MFENCLFFVVVFVSFSFPEKTTEAKMMKAGGTEIGKTLAEKSRGLFSANDWQCKTYALLKNAECFLRAAQHHHTYNTILNFVSIDLLVLMRGVIKTHTYSTSSVLL